jgi:hypothetical protein
VLDARPLPPLVSPVHFCRVVCGEGFKDKGKGKNILPNSDGILVTENVSEDTSRMYRSGSFTLHLFGANENYRDGEWEWKIRAYECQSSEQTGQQG